MTRLRPGDVIRHKGSSDGYIVTGHFGLRVTAVRTADVTNPSEWDVVCGAEVEVGRYNAVTRAIEVVMHIEEDCGVLPKHTYRYAREAVAEALRTAYAVGFRAGRQPENGGVA